MHLNEYAPPIQDFKGGRVATTLVVMFLVLLGSGAVSPDLFLVAVPPMVLLTPSNLGIELPRSWLPAPESIERDALGN